MLNVAKTSPGLLFGSFLYRDDFFSRNDLLAFWESRFGKSFSLAPDENPLYQYYATEMGAPLERFFVLSSRLYPREFLLTTKLQAVEWEKLWGQGDKRLVNLDVGFLSTENFVLATTKNYSHRVFIGQGIFVDLTYQFSKGELRTFDWTYPDYLDEQKRDFFTWGRNFLLLQQRLAAQG
jgi:hypothetical protein